MGVSSWKGARLPVPSAGGEGRPPAPVCLVHSTGSASENHKTRPWPPMGQGRGRGRRRWVGVGLRNGPGGQ